MADEKPIVHLYSKKFEKVHRKYENMVIGGFVGRRLPFQFVKESIKVVWRLKKVFVMKPYVANIYSFEFSTNEDRASVLDIGCFHIAS